MFHDEPDRPMTLTKTLDLRGGRPCWSERPERQVVSHPLSASTVDVAIVGAGVMGAMLAERLAASGRSVTLLDRRPPSAGATAASTALVMWAADTPLTELAETVGAAEAARRWRRVRGAVSSLAARIDTLGLDCGWTARPELYLAGDVLDEEGLQAEAAARQAAGLPSQFLDAATVGDRFKIAPRAALLSSDSYEVDPVALTLGLLAAARRSGATINFPADVIRLEHQPDHTLLHTSNGGVVTAAEVILATGYEAASTYLPDAFTLGSSYAIASPPGMAARWEEKALIWEAADPYLYLRTTRDGRIIVGGEDEDFVDADKRDRLIPSKGATLEAKAAALLGGEPFPVDCAWAATFGGSPDGLPAIGRAKGQDRLWLASGFGGNGVTFASLAADMITGALDGRPDPDEACFSPYRFET